MMSIDDINFTLPEDLIAERPSMVRGGSRLLILNRKDQSLTDGNFNILPHYINPGDCLVFNDTKVFKARLFGKTIGTSPKKVEILLIEKLQPAAWKVMVKNSKKFSAGDIIDFGFAGAKITEKKEDFCHMEFTRIISYDDIQCYGKTPLPPYITKKRKRMNQAEYVDEDEEWYQSELARVYGSVAAPTASLHFSAGMLDELNNKGINKTFVTLHVGPGTFKPIDDDIDAFKIHSEYIEVPGNTVNKIRETRKSGKRIIAVGTTVVRSLETMALGCDNMNEWGPYAGKTDIFIKNNFKFKAVDALITNFHMPKSTLLLLVHAFAGKDFAKESYAHAVKEKYRFFSYGDAMLII